MQVNTHIAPAQIAREILTHPQKFARIPALFADSWSVMKAARGQGITPERMARLHPNYGIITRPAPVEPAHARTRMDRCKAKVHQIATARGYTAGPSGGSAA